MYHCRKSNIYRYSKIIIPEHIHNIVAEVKQINASGIHINYQNIYLIKTNSQGNLVWDKTYEGSPYDIDQTSDGGFVIVGRTNPNNNYNLLIIKTDPEGNIE